MFCNKRRLRISLFAANNQQAFVQRGSDGASPDTWKTHRACICQISWETLKPHIWNRFLFGCVFFLFRNVWSPKGWQNKFPTKNGSYRLSNGFTYFHMQTRYTKQLKCIETRPRPVLKGPGTGKYGLGTRGRPSPVGCTVLHGVAGILLLHFEFRSQDYIYMDIYICHRE